jgi:hypothetical protein
MESVGLRLQGLLPLTTAHNWCLGIILSIPLPAMAQVNHRS